MNTNPTPDALADLIAQGRLWQAEMERSRDALTAMNDPTLAQAIVGNTQVAETLKALADSLEAFHAKPGVVVCPVCKDAAGDQQCAVCSGCGHLTAEEAAVWLAALQSPPPVVSGEADMRAIVEALGFEPDNHHNAAKCPYCTPPRVAPVVEEGRREAERTELCYLIERMCPDKPESNLGNPLGSQVEALADAILALTPVEVVGEDDTKVLELSVSAEQAYANRYPENAEMIARIIDGYRFDTPSDRARAHEVARAMAGHPRATPATAQGDVREALEGIRIAASGREPVPTASSSKGDHRAVALALSGLLASIEQQARATLKGQDNG